MLAGSANLNDAISVLAGVIPIPSIRSEIQAVQRASLGNQRVANTRGDGYHPIGSVDDEPVKERP